MNRHGGGKAAQSDILLKPILQLIAFAQICHSLKWKWRHKEQVTLCLTLEQATKVNPEENSFRPTSMTALSQRRSKHI